MSVRLRGRLLRAGLEIGDALVGRLPAGLAYPLADLIGRAWHRFAPARRRLVAANLARVCAATGRPTSGPPFERLVRDAFVAHARYYVEVLRVPHYDPRTIDQVITVEDQADLFGLLDQGGVLVVSAHFGNFEPAAIWFAQRGGRWLAPIERIEPPELFEFLSSRRGGRNQGGELVTPPRAGRRSIEALRSRQVVAVAADRELIGTSRVATFFGHPTRVPDGPAQLALLTRVPVVSGYVQRVGRDRFEGHAERLPFSATGDRAADIATLTQLVTEAMERIVSRAPEQWWGAFQPVWPDIGQSQAEPE